MKVRFPLFILIMMNFSCRMRYDTSLAKKSLVTSASESEGLDIELRNKAMQNANLTFRQSNGRIEFWNSLSSEGLDKKIQERLGEMRLNASNFVSLSSQTGNVSKISVATANTTLELQGVPGTNSPRKIFLKEKNGSHYVRSKELATDFFNHCPSNFLETNGNLQSSLQEKLISTTVTIDSDLAPSITKVIYHPSGITWSLTCESVMNWKDIPESSLVVKLSFDAHLEADQIFFPGATSDKSYKPLPFESIVMERDGFGTRFLKVDSNGKHGPAVIQRWNPYRQHIVIDDTHDTFGNLLTSSEYGQWIKEGLKIAIADLRNKFQIFGKKLVLTSEQPSLRPDIAFSIGNGQNPAGPGILLFDDKTGEMRQARIRIGSASNLQGRIKMIDGFYHLGLIDDPKKSFRDSFLFMVIHEFGHALGLRDNFSGYGSNNNWGNDLQAVMSDAMIGFPIEFISDKVEWKPHDLFSLKILYADLGTANQWHRQELTSEVLKYPLSKDEMAQDDSYVDIALHIAQALSYLESTNHPKMSKFRQTDPLWKSKVTSIYKQSYDVDIK